MLHMSYIYDTNCMTMCFIGNIGKKNLANYGDSPNLPKISPRQSFFVLYSMFQNTKKFSPENLFI